LDPSPRAGEHEDGRREGEYCDTGDDYIHSAEDTGAFDYAGRVPVALGLVAGVAVVVLAVAFDASWLLTTALIVFLVGWLAFAIRDRRRAT
jgi:sorbitol-specific phosphotransferase system component IIC